jgi:FkbM family methyltransferase
VNRRLGVLRRWAAGHRNEVSARELARFLCSPGCERKAQRRIRETRPAGDFLEVWLDGAVTPLYWPARLDPYGLHMVVAETMDPVDWHFYEVPETRVRPGDTVVDCGAAEGLFSLVASRVAGRVYAIEPSPTWIAALRQTFRDAPAVSVLECALGSERGMAQLSAGVLDSRLTDGGAGEPVTVETVDALFHDRGLRVDYLKADLEGHELEMLRGARETIRSCRPRVAITTYHMRDHALAIADLLREIVPTYRIRVKGIEPTWGAPMMLHAHVQD